jgi:hypothetical protein
MSVAICAIGMVLGAVCILGTGRGDNVASQWRARSAKAES